MTIPEEEARMLAGELVNRQNLLAIGGGGALGVLAGVWHIKKGDDNSESFTDLITGVGGGILGQAFVFFVASRQPATNPFCKFFQDKCIWLIHTPIPAIVGAASCIGIRMFLSRQN